MDKTAIPLGDISGIVAHSVPRAAAPWSHIPLRTRPLDFEPGLLLSKTIDQPDDAQTLLLATLEQVQEHNHPSDDYGLGVTDRVGLQPRPRQMESSNQLKCILCLTEGWLAGP